ncbi:MAG: nucleoside triphosphate pyrophosphohydrolase [Dehalococcoidia bacterium]|nr:nucleoside triphosphate pyrophosphohydrolase [Dehalococcoidia bacterium]|tara:strand:+ start:5945 stop:6751 length:807 start_codon:yes stop_codon:yes gene_type:complete
MENNKLPDGNIDSFDFLVQIVKQLRAPGGCPWDREQTHSTLKRNLIEEAYEVIDAIDREDSSSLVEELGDLLVQIIFHSDIGQELGTFKMSNVIQSINEKMIRRHPHVFSDIEVSDSYEVEKNWDKIKAEERQVSSESKSMLGGIPEELPSLAAAQLIQERVVRAGFDWEDVSDVLDKIAEEIAEFKEAVTDAEKLHEIGDILFSIVNLSRWYGIYAEEALRNTNKRFSTRYTAMEDIAEKRGLDFNALDLAYKESLWREVKRNESLS